MSDLLEIANKPNELLDLVNKDDQVIGEVVRKEANSNPDLIHREVAVVIINNNNEVLLQKRSKYKKVNPLVWSMTAGHILKGADIKQTAHRELQEEIGFDTSLIFLTKKLHRYDWETHFSYYFLGLYNNQEINCELAEVEEVKFVNRQELNKILKYEEVNQHYLSIIQDLWEGVFNKQITKLKEIS